MTKIRFNRQRTTNIPQSREIIGSQSVGNLKDIQVSSPAQDQILVYNSLSGKFVNVALSDSIESTLDEIDGGTY